MLVQFAAWLALRPLAASTRASHTLRAASSLRWLEAAGGHGAVASALVDRVGCSAAARDWRRQQLTDEKASPATVNLGIAALGAMGECLGLGQPDSPRVATAGTAPKALPEREFRALLAAADRAGDQRRDLVVRVHPARRLQRQPLGDQLGQPAPLGQPQHRDQPRHPTKFGSSTRTDMLAAA